MAVYLYHYIAVAFIVLQCFTFTHGDNCLDLTDNPDLEPYVDPVPVMPRVTLRGTSSKRPLVIGAYKTTQKLHRDLPASTIYAFGRSEDEAATPGPTLLAEKDVPAYVRWENHLNDTNHTFPIDPTVPKAEPPRGGVPLVVHLHGGATQPDSDGHPDAWITALGDTGPNYTTSTFHYSNAQPATMLWYHDHSYGYTRLSVPAGLAGLYLVLSAEDDPSWLPSSLRESNETSVESKYVHDLVIQGKQVFANGTINYPTGGINPNTHPNWCIDYFGDLLVVNGKIWPYMNVTRGVHRLRLLNGGNSRFLVLSLSNNMSFVKIGTEGGYLNTPVVQTEVRLGPAQRADVLVDFSSLRRGELVTMSNTGPAPFPNGNAPKNTSVMQFRVGSKRGPAVPDLPASLAPNQTLQEIVLQTTGLNVSNLDFNAMNTRRFLVDTIQDETGINYLSVDKPKVFRDNATEIVNVDADEVWEFQDLARTVGTLVAHPIHIHLINFVVISQQRFNVSRWETNDCFLNVSYPDPQSCFVEDRQLPDLQDYGWKDTAVIWPASITRFYVPFRPRDRKNFPFDTTTSPGYVWHCHILEHEDNEMMRPLLFVNNSST